MMFYFTLLFLVVIVSNTSLLQNIILDLSP